MKGGFGLQSLKEHLGLVFRHHDAGEDARAAAEVVLRARAKTPNDISSPVPANYPVSKSTISASSQARPPASMPITREALKKLVINRLDNIAKVHPAGHQSAYSNRYVLTSSAGERIEIMFDKGDKSHANLWLLERFLPAAVLGNLSTTPSPGSDVYRKRNTAGELVYGRHSALRSMLQLERGDLVCVNLQTFGELHAILGHLQG